jgi:osmoprotectant transport system substrate-binding protein
VFVVVMATVLGACSSSESSTAGELVDTRSVRVASFDFAESELLAEIFAQALERQDIKVERRMRLGSRELVQPALESGLVDVVPEYLTSSLEFVTLGHVSTVKVPTARRQLEQALSTRGVIPLEPAAAIDRNAIAVRSDMAKDRLLERISDLAPIASDLRFIGPPECAERPSCLPALRDRYGLQFKSFTPVPPGLPIALQLESEEADVGVAFTTDPLVEQHGLVLLRPDKEDPRADNVVPLVRTAALKQHPAIKNALDSVTKRLTTDELRALNARVARGEKVEEVARSWLSE